MSKKKNASRSAMTLKDFHGGSIPSDLPLPSAPGMTVDRSAYERQGSGTWMSPTLGRGYGGDRGGYSRQGSASSVRTFEDKASYFPNPANIGRNYDEDERKPVDGRPRSSHSLDRYEDHSYEERRGGFSMDRYSLEEQGNFNNSTPSFSESRSLGSSDRFPPSVIAGGGFESDNFVHDEFGLIPVGPPPAALVTPREAQPRQPPSTYQRELVQTPPEHPSYALSHPMSSAPPFASQQQIASSPPRSWRNPNHQQPLTTAPRLHQESATNVWTARREGDYNRTPTAEVASESLVSFPWRSQGSFAKIAEASAVDKVSSGRWQTDSSRPSGATEKRPSVAFPSREQGREPTRHNSYVSDVDADSGRGAHASDFTHPPHPAEGGRGASSLEAGRGTQSGDMSQRAYDGSTRSLYVNQRRVVNGESVDGGGYLEVGKGGNLDTAGYTDERGVAHSVFSDAGGRGTFAPEINRRNYGEEQWSGGVGFTEADINSNADLERYGYSDSGRGVFNNSDRPISESKRGSYVESGRGSLADGEVVEYTDKNRAGSNESSKGGFASSGRGSSTNTERGSQYEPPHSGYSERARFPEDNEGSFATDGEQSVCVENGRSPYVPEVGRGSFGGSASSVYQSEVGVSPYHREESRASNSSDGSRVLYGDHERSRSPFALDRAGAVSPDHLRSPPTEGWHSGVSSSVLPSPVDPSRSLVPTMKGEPAERPKLKLLPRSKPLGKETSSAAGEDATGYEEMGIEVRSHPEEKRPAEILAVESSAAEQTVANELGGVKPMNEVEQESNRKVVRPKLNLKPRTQPTEAEPVEGSQKVRQVVFGGARPRELVLKERGVDDQLVVLEIVQTQGMPSSTPSTNSGLKSDRLEVARVERQDSLAEEKQEHRRYEKPERLIERPVSNRLDGNRSDWDIERKDGRRELDRLDRRNSERYESRRDVDRQDNRRDGDNRRDIDKQDSWRRPAESPVVTAIGGRNPSSTVSSLVDPSPHTPGKSAYSATASAVELAQVFSRSSSIGSTMTGVSRGVNNLRSPLSPIPKSSAQVYGPGYGNGIPSPYGTREAPFSRLAEAPPPARLRDVYQGGDYGGDGLANGYGSGKLSGYNSGDLKSTPPFGSSETVSGWVRCEENEDFPGKRGLPLRQKEGYYD